MTEALVIGSGPNGLSAAITLARAGVEVTVLEAADRAGGAVATEELTLPGFHHDIFSAVYPATVASPVFARWPLERHGLRWTHPRYCYAHPLDDGRAGGCSPATPTRPPPRWTRCTRATARPGARSRGPTWSTSAPGAT